MVTSRREFLKKAAAIEGIYVPSLYDVSYHPDGTIASMEPLEEGVPSKVKKQVVKDLSHTYYPSKPLVPYIRATQDTSRFRDPAWLYKGMPFLSGRNDLPANPSQGSGIFKAKSVGNAGKHRL